MLITTRFRASHHTDHVSRYIEWRIRAALEHIGYRVVAVSVHVERTHRSEVTCRMHAQVAEGRHMIADGRDRALLTAIDRAAEKLADVITRAMGKTRERRRHRRAEPTAFIESETEAL